MTSSSSFRYVVTQEASTTLHAVDLCTKLIQTILSLQDVWKRVDKVYLDRTFNGQDWFALRQTALKKKIKTQQDVYDAIKVLALC